MALGVPILKHFRVLNISFKDDCLNSFMVKNLMWLKLIFVSRFSGYENIAKTVP